MSNVTHLASRFVEIGARVTMISCFQGGSERHTSGRCGSCGLWIDIQHVFHGRVSAAHNLAFIFATYLQVSRVVVGLRAPRDNKGETAYCFTGECSRGFCS
jgi:hypothetical protein